MPPVLRMILQRLGLGLLTLFVVSILISVAIELLPGDLAQQILGQTATPENLAAFRKEVGLDQDPVTRYFTWLGGAIQGDFGVSMASRRPIADLIANRLYNTLFLALYAAAIAVPLAVTLGLLAALYRNSLYDRAVNVFTLGSISTPEFFVAYILILWLVHGAGLFGVLSTIPTDATFGQQIEATTLPAITLTLVVTAHMMRMTRAAIINLLASPYIEMARLKGIPRYKVILRHALPNALAPIINVIAINLAYLITGVVIVEQVFTYPGLGGLMVDSVSKQDATVVQACCLIFASVYILLNLIADVLSIVTNPRLLHPK